MDVQNIIDQIKQKDFDREYFVKLVLNDEIARDIVVSSLVNNKHIMVYYHCYYVVDLASQKDPGLFYDYFDDFAELLDHNNSYHRNIGLAIIANLTAIDADRKLDSIIDRYLLLIDDPKVMTGNCCIKNLAKIIGYRKDLTEKIVNLLLSLEHTTRYQARQIELLKHDILTVFDLVVGNYHDSNRLYAYIKACLHSISPKTRKKARELSAKYSL